MDYPVDFARKVMEEYDNDSKMAALLEEGNPFLGRYLDDSSQGGISPQAILDALDAGDIGGLRARAGTLVRRKELYAEWGRLSDAQRN